MWSDLTHLLNRKLSSGQAANIQKRLRRDARRDTDAVRDVEDDIIHSGHLARIGIGLATFRSAVA